MAETSTMARNEWEKQGVYDEPRLSDIVEAYEEMGFEVRLQPFDPLAETGCTECMKASPERYKTLYTRKR